MKSKYLYIEAGAMFTRESKVMFVWLGSSAQATRDYLFLVAHSAEHNFFFEPMSVKVSEFLARLQKSVGHICISSVDGRDLVRSIKFQVRCLSSNSSSHQAKKILDGVYNAKCQISKLKSNG